MKSILPFTIRWPLSFYFSPFSGHHRVIHATHQNERYFLNCARRDRMTTITVTHLSKKIKKTFVLKDINYTFQSGKAYGLFGRNGSGKTMLLRALSGLIYPTEGTVAIDGQVLHKDISFPPSIGVIIENTSLLPQYDAFTNLKILAKIKKRLRMKTFDTPLHASVWTRTAS